MKPRGWQLLLVILLVTLSLDYSIAPAPDRQHVVGTGAFTVSDVGHISGIPYVWQELNGYCLFASFSMAAQSLGIDIGMGDLFVVSGAGLSALYVNSEEVMMLFPGTLVKQTVGVLFASDLYGLDLGVFLDPSTEHGTFEADLWTESGVNYTTITGIEGALDLLRESISSGHPLLIYADCSKLPPTDYDILRLYGLDFETTGSGHAILIVGYNDTSRTVQVYDPGLGVFGDEYGYPEDGRWNYSMSYTTLESAWQPMGYTCIRLESGSGKAQDFEWRLAQHISDYLIGNRTAYLQGNENFHFMSVGANAFRGMSLDFDPRGLFGHMQWVDKMYWADVLKGLGYAFEGMITLQYISYRAALNRLPFLLPDMNLTEFIVEAEKALPHFEALSCNESLIDVYPVEHGSPIYGTLNAISGDYVVTSDLTYALEQHSDELRDISSHLAAIADSWKSAGEVLAGESGSAPDGVATGGIIIGFGATVIGVLALCVLRKPRNPDLMFNRDTRE